MARPLRLSGAPRLVARMAEVHPSLPRALCPSPRSAVAGSVPVGYGSLPLPVEGLARVIFLAGATG